MLTRKSSTGPIDMAPAADEVPRTSDRRKSARTPLLKLEKSVEKRNAKRATNLSPIQEEHRDEQKSTPLIGTTSSKIDRPALRLSSYLERFWKSHIIEQSADELSENLSEDLEMKMDWSDVPLEPSVRSDAHIPSPLSKEFNDDQSRGKCKSDETSGNALFDFNLQQAQEEVENTLPRRNAWDWSSKGEDLKGIGIAISDPMEMDDEGRWRDEMNV